MAYARGARPAWAAAASDVGTADEAESISGFAQAIGVPPESLAFMWQLPADLQRKVIGCFDPSGTKDGNVLGRLQGYAAGLAKRNGLVIDFLSPLQSRAHSAPPAQRAGPPALRPLAREPRPASGASAEAQTEQPQLEQVDMETLSYLSEAGLDGATVEFITQLPVDLRSTVLRGFDLNPNADDEGWTIRERLLAYVREQWCWSLSLEQATVDFVGIIPEDILRTAINRFDPSGTKDGNVGARLQKYLQGLCSRAGVDLQAAEPWPPPRARAEAPSHQPPPAASLGGHVPSTGQPPTTAATPRSGGGESFAESFDVPTFLESLGIRPEQSAKFQALPEEVQTGVVLEFDPSGTKDGNVWGRLIAFAHRVARRVGCSPAVVAQLQVLRDAARGGVAPAPGVLLPPPPTTAPPPPQLVHYGVPCAGTPCGGGCGGGAPTSLRAFAARWHLDQTIVAFIEALPTKVTTAVLMGFDGSATKDGNIWGRLLPYCRVQWAKSFGIDRHVSDMLKGLPEESQMICLTQFDPTAYKASDVHAQLRTYIEALQGGDGSAAVAAPRADDGGSRGQYADPAAYEFGAPNEVEDFLRRIGVEPSSATDLLSPLPPDVLQRVFTEFDPRGTKDGNVLGRLEGFVRHLLRKRGAARGPQDGVRTIRARHY